ncbi:heavy metal translocating P-type ATPase [Streptomyces sp. NPDC001922]|uniref:heavy metal translocating P-type ATPase n=1 Tax=Streptomyces sp. NPDC001922 TaxID=3364624 RepID=UPI0036BA71D5
MPITAARDASVATEPRRLPPEARWAALALAAFAAAAGAQAAGAPGLLRGALYAVCYAAGGWEPALAGVRALRERTLDVDLLMVVAALGAAAIGQVLDGGLLIVIFAASGALEAVATARTEASVRSLLSLAPQTATRVSAGGEERVAAAELAVGDVVLVRPGERVAADGRVLGGRSDVDQSTITGEPLPADKEAGDEVFAGTLNGRGSLRVRVERDPSDSVIARIVAMVEEASRTKAPTQLWIERIEQRYSLAVVVGALALFALPLAFGAALEPTLLRAMTFMIVASPCAVVLSTMPPLLAAIANAGRNGVLVKSAVVMEELGRTTVVALDKTGTVTQGAPRVVEVRGPAEALRLAASVEAESEHPVARAVVAAARERGLIPYPVRDFVSRTGFGVEAVVKDRRVTVGRPDQDAAGPTITESPVENSAAAPGKEPSGMTTVQVGVDGVAVATLVVADRPRPDAPAAVARLTALTGVTPVLLTGDARGPAEHTAAACGIEEVRAGLLPEEKVAAVSELGAGGGRVLLVGDGVNDAPALATAQVGVAMGGTGADLSLQAADAIVVRDELTAVPAVIALSRRARRLVVQNLVIAGCCIVGLVAWDTLGELPLPLGVVGHEGSTVLVALNGLRMLRAPFGAESGAPRPSGPVDRSGTPRPEAGTGRAAEAAASGAASPGSVPPPGSVPH